MATGNQEGKNMDPLTASPDPFYLMHQSSGKDSEKKKKKIPLLTINVKNSYLILSYHPYIFILLPICCIRELSFSHISWFAKKSRHSLAGFFCFQLVGFAYEDISSHFQEILPLHCMHNWWDIAPYFPLCEIKEGILLFPHPWWPHMTWVHPIRRRHSSAAHNQERNWSTLHIKINTPMSGFPYSKNLI